jgi:putative membrane protein
MFGSRPMKGALLGLAGLAAFVAVSAVAQSGASASDKHFVTDALEGGNAEIALGHIAQDKGANEDVKQFGQKMVDDHTKMNDQMSQVATQIGVTPPTGKPMSATATEAKLKVLSGDAFDKSYIQAMVKDHRDDLAAFKKEIASTSNPTIKEAATQGSQKVAEHLHMIEMIAQKHNVKVN